MSILDNAVRHFGNSADNTVYTVDVKEWDGTIFFKSTNAMNGLAYQKYIKAAQEADFASLVDVLILRARNEDGTKMFTQADKKKLMACVSPDVITDIVTRMTAIDNQDAEVEKKDLKVVS